MVRFPHRFHASVTPGATGTLAEEPNYRERGRGVRAEPAPVIEARLYDSRALAAVLERGHADFRAWLRLIGTSREVISA